MAVVTIDWDGSATNLRAIFSSGALFLPTAGGALQAHSGTATHYHVSAASSVALSATTNRHTFTVPVPSVLPVVLDVSILDIATGDIAGVGLIRLDADGDEIDGTPLVLSQDVPEDDTSATVGGALNGAGAQAFRKWVIDPENLTLTLYGSDGTTVMHVFNLDSLATPLSRTPV